MSMEVPTCPYQQMSDCGRGSIQICSFESCLLLSTSSLPPCPLSTCSYLVQIRSIQPSCQRLQSLSAFQLSCSCNSIDRASMWAPSDPSVGDKFNVGVFEVCVICKELPEIISRCILWQASWRSSMKWETRIDDSLMKLKAEYDAGVPCSLSRINGTYGARRIDSWSPPESMLLN